ncbi:MULTISPECIES: hypothetical protein [Providencia]|uniref:Uncharacterized protein n=1 Tax=Providencia huaxiensis TaxID=2027290 RepID=A0A8I2AJE9_9GAMM|nr:MULTISPECIES: hypothetical protein [Providencia]MBQ0267374.1 hypothetical protein [Providencia huaxiensis]MCD2527912.1 hypothetical protein [Providencia huaxiensis]MCG9537478.1 hypothetical protein [Providencia huaxiensis]QPE15644.1 hypothetical protein IMQ36_10490 [Providencia rettgeri]
MKNASSSHLNFTKLKFNPLFLCVSIIVGTPTIAQAAIMPTNGAGILNQGNGANCRLY